MSSVIPPWPPDDYQAPQPYDQRGACWPYGVCRPSKLPMRYDVIGTREGGFAVDLLWSGLATGVLAVVEPSITTRSQWWGVMNLNVPPAQPSIVTITPTADPELWFVDLAYYTYTIGPLFAFCFASGMMTSSSCGSDVILPVTTAFGAPDPPDFVTMQHVDWWQMSNYPFNV